jgi:hypothetical protein
VQLAPRQRWEVKNQQLHPQNDEREFFYLLTYFNNLVKGVDAHDDGAS